MQLKFALPAAAALLCAAFPGLAQQQAAPEAPPPAESQAQIQQAAQAFGQCIGAGLHGLAPAVAPEAGAASVFSGCTSQREQLEQAVETMIETLPAEQQTIAREQMRSQLAEAETEIAEAIRQQRMAAAAAAGASEE